MARIVKLVWIGAGVLVATSLGAVMPSRSQQAAEAISSAELHRRAVAALPEARHVLDDQLPDYPSARFRNVHARFVRSVYSDDEGQSNRVPWRHRGGFVIVLCGEINARNRMGGYTGWQAFSFEPSQTDVVTMFDNGAPRQPQQINLARDPELLSAEDSFEGQSLALLCGEEGVTTDPADLAEQLGTRGNP